MKRFANLYAEIDSTTSTNRKVEVIADYFGAAEPADAAWAVYFLSGGRPKRLIPVRRIAHRGMQESRVPEWLFEESYHQVGDLGETIALLLPPAPSESAQDNAHSLEWWVRERLLPLATQSEDDQRRSVLDAWRELDGTERYIWNKLITGSFRVGVSEQLVIRALAKASGIDEDVVAHRLSGTWIPSPENFASLVAADSSDADRSRPFPFYLAYSLEGELESLGAPQEWQAEWKWDGIRAQVIRRDGQTYIWSRGGELVTDRFPEIVEAARGLDEGTVLDGEIMPWRDNAALPFAQLQRRIGRKKVGPKILAEVPVVLIAYDQLELNGVDIRAEPLSLRRAHLEKTLNTLGEKVSASSMGFDANAPSALRGAVTGNLLLFPEDEPSAPVQSGFVLSPTTPLATWSDARHAHSHSRDHRAEGLMLKRLDSEYGVGRRKGSWWKWKVQPFSVDAVMVYAQPGHGKRALLHTDYTFAVRDGDDLVPFAKAYSGLTDVEIRQLDAWIRRHTLQKFGPVRHVEPLQVFELHFEAIQASPRHKSGVAVRFPRIARWRTDKPVTEIDTIESLRALIEATK